MNNQLKKTFDSHNNATIIESKPNTKFGFCMFLQNKVGFKIQTSLRHSHIGENDNYFGNYGIYANGLLVETCSKRYLKELSNMSLID